MSDLELGRIYVFILGLITLPFAFIWSFGWGIAWVCALFLIMFVIYIDWKDLK